MTVAEFNVGQIYKKIDRECFMSDAKIKNIKNVCAATREDYNNIKACIMPRSIFHAQPLKEWWSPKACKIAIEENLFHKTFTFDWKQVVDQFVKSPRCKGQF